MYNNRDNFIKAFENRVFSFKDGFQSWVKVDKKRINRIKNQIQNAKNNNLQAKPKCDSLIYFDESYKLIQGIAHSKITHKEVLKVIIDTRKDIKRTKD